MKEYVDLLKILWQENNWGLLTLFISSTPEERVEKMKKIFLTACKERDDKAAEKNLFLLLIAIDDTHLLPLTKEEKGVKRIEDSCYNKKVKKAEENSQKEKAELLMSLYEQLAPSQKTVVRQTVTQDDTILVDISSPALLKTKEMMLNIIAERWRNTEDMDEADKLFDFLMNIPTQFDEEKKMRMDVIRKATDSQFPVTKLTHHILQLLLKGVPEKSWSESKYGVNKIISILAIARARNQNLEATRKEMAISHTLYGCNEAAYDFTNDVAKKIAKFDAEIKELQEMMQPTHKPGDPYVESIQGEINISYTDANTAVVTITNASSNGVYVSLKFKTPEEEYHAQFEEIRDLVIKWREKHPDRKLEVTLNIIKRKPFQDDSDAETVFTRSQKF